MEAVKIKRAEDIEMVPEKSPVAVSSANGQVRTLKMSLETRYNRKIGEGHNILPWLIMYAAMLINICSIGEDGKTAYERRRGKKFKRELPEFGESIFFLKPGSSGKEKLDERWGDGVYLGVIEESSEIYIGTIDGILKVRTFARRGEKIDGGRRKFMK